RFGGQRHWWFRRRADRLSIDHVATAVRILGPGNDQRRLTAWTIHGLARGLVGDAQLLAAGGTGEENRHSLSLSIRLFQLPARRHDGNPEYGANCHEQHRNPDHFATLGFPLNQINNAQDATDTGTENCE